MGENRQKPLITVPDNNKNFKGAGFKRWDAFVANYLAEHPERKINPPADSKKKEEEIMTDENKWSEDEIDLKLYNSMDTEGKRAWRKIFGLPQLLKRGSLPADAQKDAENDT